MTDLDQLVKQLWDENVIYWKSTFASKNEL